MSSVHNNNSKRRVRFSNDAESDDVTVEILGPYLKPASDMSEQQKFDLWIQSNESKRIRERCLETVNAAREKHMSEQDNPLSYTNLYSKVYMEVMDGHTPSKDDMNCFMQWIRLSSSKRGLEKVIIPEVNTKRRNRIKCCIRAVLDTQEYSRQRYDMVDQSTAPLVSKALRMASEHFSLPNQRFSHLVGKADADAVLRDRRRMMIKRRAAREQQQQQEEMLKTAAPSFLASRKQQRPCSNDLNGMNNNEEEENHTVQLF